MTSQINPNNINGAYPVAGQDNNSQGFRDNFTNTKTNFQYAAGEITALQNAVLLKAPLTSGGSIDNNMGYGNITNAQLKSPSYTSVNLGSLSTTVPLVYSAGSYQTATVGANVALSFSGWPAAGQYAELYAQIITTAANVVITLPSAVTLGKTGVQGLSGQNLTIAQAGTYTFEFTTSDNGSTITIQDLSRPLAYYTNNVSMLGNLSVAGTITGTFAGNISGNLVVPGSNTQVVFNTNGSANTSSNFTFSTATNTLTVTGNASVTGNVVTGNVTVAGNISAGNVTGNLFGNIQSNSTVSITGNITGGNILSGSILSTAGNISTGSNIIVQTSANVGTSLRVGTTANIGSSLTVGSFVSATGNVTSGGLISAAGNITGDGVAFLTSSEDLADNNPANLNVTTSYFTTGAVEAATLAAGTPGQIKVFAAVDTTAGNMVITVTNAGWKATGTGTITFSSLGQACTLQYVNSKWFCIGNNGAAFA